MQPANVSIRAPFGSRISQMEILDDQIVLLDRRIAVLTRTLQDRELEVSRLNDLYGRLSAELARTTGCVPSSAAAATREVDKNMPEAPAHRPTSDHLERLQKIASILHRLPGWWALLPARFSQRKLWDRLKGRGLFDAEAYLRVHADVAQSGVDPVYHYVRHGVSEDRYIPF
jgi:hypothetical protein